WSRRTGGRGSHGAREHEALPRPGQGEPDEGIGDRGRSGEELKSGEVPLQAPPRASRKAPSVVIVNTGDGKGKSTAAFGTVLRAVARGWKVCVIQFLKSDRWKVGEKEMATRLGVEWWTIGDGFTWDSRDM